MIPPAGRLGRLPLERPPAVAGSFYPAGTGALESLVRVQLDRLPAVPDTVAEAPRSLVGLLVPHAGLVYSGLVAAAGWRLLDMLGGEPVSVVILGTNHRAGWLDGAGLWETGSWQTPLGDVAIDEALAGAVLGLGPPFLVDRASHVDEHSIEVQLPFLRTVAPSARVVPIAVAAGTGEPARDAGVRLGGLVRELRRKGANVLLAASTDMAHYPPADGAESVTRALLPSILALDPVGLSEAEAAFRRARGRGLVCGMCGIEPAVMALAAFGAMGAHAVPLMAATSATAGGSHDRTVGYLSVAFLLPAQADEARAERSTGPGVGRA